MYLVGFPLLLYRRDLHHDSVPDATLSWSRQSRIHLILGPGLERDRRGDFPPGVSILLPVARIVRRRRMGIRASSTTSCR